MNSILNQIQQAQRENQEAEQTSSEDENRAKKQIGSLADDRAKQTVSSKRRSKPDGEGTKSPLDGSASKKLPFKISDPMKVEAELKNSIQVDESIEQPLFS